MTLEEAWRRFWLRVNKRGPRYANLGRCWIWTGAKNWKGYGITNSRRMSSRLSHRALYLKLVGPVPKGKELDHRCRQRACCNPKHLRPVTHLENVQAGKAGSEQAARNHCPQGHPYTPENTYVPPPRPSRKSRNRICRECSREAHKRWQKRNPEKLRAQWRRKEERLKQQRRANASKSARLLA